MSLAIVYSRAQCGMEAPLVTVEVHIANGLPSLSIVGLPETAVRESKDRVRGAILNSRFEFPTRRITINLAPADLPKDGGRFDLPIALGILAASGQIPTTRLPHYEFAAELALSGELRGVHGILPMTLKTAAAKRTAVVPRENAAEATLVGGAGVLAGCHLLDITGHLTGVQPLEPQPARQVSARRPDCADLADVRGQHHARRALEIAAAGGHCAHDAGVLPRLLGDPVWRPACRFSSRLPAGRRRRGDGSPASNPRKAPLNPEAGFVRAIVVPSQVDPGRGHPGSY